VGRAIEGIIRRRFLCACISFFVASLAYIPVPPLPAAILAASSAAAWLPLSRACVNRCGVVVLYWCIYHTYDILFLFYVLIIGADCILANST
jgi:hypothetical protein